MMSRRALSGSVYNALGLCSELVCKFGDENPGKHTWRLGPQSNYLRVRRLLRVSRAAMNLKAVRRAGSQDQRMRL